MAKIDPNRMFVPRADVAEAIDLVTAKLEKEIVAHSVTMRALELEQAAHAATQGELEQEIAAHSVTKEALALEQTAHAATQGELDNLKGQLDNLKGQLEHFTQTQNASHLPS
jgi:hypothetical protein